MLKIKIFISFLLVLFGFLSVFSQTKILKPQNNKNNLTIVESGKNKIYYRILKNDPSLILVKGPGILQVLTRAVITAGKADLRYSVYYRIDGGEYTRVEVSDVHNSVKAKFRDKSNGIPAATNTFDIELSQGEHTLEIKTGDENTDVVARYLFKKFKVKKIKWIMLSPIPPSEPVDLVTHENVIHYYRFSEKKPLKIRINGPTTLRVLTRFENHYDMKGRIDYRIQLKENGKIIHTYLLSSLYSEVTAYKKNSKLVPGKAREFYIQVPPGKHNYTVIPLDKDKRTILARVLFPKKDVKLEE
jgi:uncharacterized membrane protein